MEAINKILYCINKSIKSVQHHSKDKRNSELILAYYNGYETALKEIKKTVIKTKKEEEKCQIN